MVSTAKVVSTALGREKKGESRAASMSSRCVTPTPASTMRGATKVRAAKERRVAPDMLWALCGGHFSGRPCGESAP